MVRGKKMNVVLLTNIMTPYRRFFYDQLYLEMKERKIDFHIVLMADTEPNRNWSYNEYKTEYSILLPHKTITVSGVFIHLNYRIKELYKELRPDIVICAGSYMYPALWRTLQLEKSMGYKTYYWSESHLSEVRNYGSIKLKIRDFIRRKVIGEFDGFWYAGKFSKEFIDCYAKPKAEYVFVPNLIDTCKFGVQEYSQEHIANIKRNYGLDASKLIMMTPARLSAVKGLMDFLKLYQQVNNREKVTYLIAGDGELKGEIERFCQKNKLDVHLLGYKSEQEMLDLYSITDLFVLPSLSDPNPLTCIEACWSRLPLLVSRHVGNYPEIIQQGKNGYVFEYENANKAISIIEELIDKDETWRHMAGNISYRVAEKLYNPELCVKRIISETIRGANK